MTTPHHDGSPLHVSTQTPGLGEVVRVRLRVPTTDGGGVGATAADGTPIGPLAWVGTRSNPNREPRFSEAVRLPSARLAEPVEARLPSSGLPSARLAEPVEARLPSSGLPSSGLPSGGLPSTGSGSGWDWWEAGVEVENPVHGYRWLLVGEDGRQHWLNQRGLSLVETRDHDDFKLVAHEPAPAWAAESVLYQVFPDRFAKSADAPFDRLRERGELPEWAIPADWGDAVDPEPPGRSHQVFGGDLDGVRERLDHLVSLGVNLLYLTPVFPARSNHRYDASTFDRVDDLLGGDDALVRLVEAAHARGIRVIGDLTSNHSGDAHEWFRTAQADPGSVERGFYFFRPSTLRQAQGTAGSGSGSEYESWLGVPSLPKFDWSSRELRRRFIEGPDSVVARYLAAPFGLDGWRIDVANMTGRLGSTDLNAEVRQTIRATMLEVNPDTILLAESTNDAASDFQGDAWHGAMTYTVFTRPLWSWLQEPGSPAGGGLGFALGHVPTLTAPQMIDAQTAFAAGFPWRTRLQTMNALDTHDTPRFRTHARPGTVPVALGLSVTLPGIPVVWAGDEFALTGVDGEASRMPIPWSRVSEPEIAETLDTYRTLLGLRRAQPVLATGGLRWLGATDDAVAFVREAADASVLVFAARSASALELATGALPQLAADASGSPELLAAFGDVRLEASGTPSIVADGPAFAAWRLAGVRVPTAGSEQAR